MKKFKYIAAVICAFAASSTWAQQDALFTQYMTNPISINPAIAGVRNVSNVSTVFRKQWVSIDGAPTTINLSYDGTFNEDNVGLAANLLHDRIGPVVQTGLYVHYAYHLRFDENRKRNLSLGLLAGANYHTFDLTTLDIYEPDDDINYTDVYHKLMPNFGVGAFYYSDAFFAGVSIPKLLRNKYSNESNNLSDENREERHVFGMVGGVIAVVEDIKFKPSVIGRVVNGAPYSLDLNATFMFVDQIWLGATYRVKSSWGFLARWQVNENIHIGYSFDLSNNRLRHYNNGTHEIFLSYDFVNDKNRDKVRRFF